MAKREEDTTPEVLGRREGGRSRNRPADRTEESAREVFERSTARDLAFERWQADTAKKPSDVGPDLLRIADRLRESLKEKIPGVRWDVDWRREGGPSDQYPDEGYREVMTYSGRVGPIAATSNRMLKLAQGSADWSNELALQIAETVLGTKKAADDRTQCYEGAVARPDGYRCTASDAAGEEELTLKGWTRRGLGRAWFCPAHGPASGPCEAGMSLGGPLRVVVRGWNPEWAPYAESDVAGCRAWLAENRKAWERKT